MSELKKRNILLSSGHPAQVHNFKYLKKELENKGHTVYWMATDKDISIYLLNQYNIDHIVLEKPGSGKLSKLVTLLKNTSYIRKYIKEKNIDIAISRISPYISLACYSNKVPHIGITDTETAGVYDSVFGKLNSAVLTSTSYQRQLREDQIRLNGNIELFYLHPNRFTPASNVHSIVGLAKGKPYIICRFVSWDAYHDKGLSGFTDENKLKAVEVLSQFGQVFITSEKKLPKKLEPYRIQIPPERMHDVLSGCTLFFGESATMASESAVLGRPAIYLDKHGRGYTDEEEEYGLVWNFKNSEEEQERAIQKAVELLKNDTLEENIRDNHQYFLSQKIDMTSFMVWFIENWPKSKQIMLDDANYQHQFL